MTAPLLARGDGMRRRLDIAASPIQARVLFEQAIALGGGVVLASRPDGFDFAPAGPHRPARGALDVARSSNGSACTLRIGWPVATMLRFTAAMLGVAAVALPLGARVGPRGFAVTLVALALFGFGRYLFALLSATLALRRLALIAHVLATSTLYHAPARRSRVTELRGLVAELCAGRLTPHDFSRARRDLLANGS